MKAGTHNQLITNHSNHNQRVPTAYPSDPVPLELLRETKEPTRLKRNTRTTNAMDEPVA